MCGHNDKLIKHIERQRSIDQRRLFLFDSIILIQQLSRGLQDSCAYWSVKKDMCVCACVCTSFYYLFSTFSDVNTNLVWTSSPHGGPKLGRDEAKCNF